MPAGTKAKPRTKPPETRREELMNAAQELFLAQGLGPTTIDQITAGAQVAKGTFYLHFTSKEEVMAALRDRYVEDFVLNIRGATDACLANDWIGKLSAWARAAVAGYLDTTSLHDLVFHQSPPPDRGMYQQNCIVEHLTDILQKGAAAGAWTVDEPRFAAAFLFQGLHGTLDDALAVEKPVDQDRLVRRLEELFFRVVSAKADAFTETL